MKFTFCIRKDFTSDASGYRGYTAYTYVPGFGDQRFGTSGATPEEALEKAIVVVRNMLRDMIQGVDYRTCEVEIEP
jgi:hypothetical protein